MLVKGYADGRADWRAYLAKHKIEAFQVTYETLFIDFERVCRNLCVFLDVPCPETWIFPPYEKLADAHSEEWIARYEAETS